MAKKAKAVQAVPKRGRGRPPGMTPGSVRAKRAEVREDVRKELEAFAGDFSAVDAAGNFRRLIEAEVRRLATGEGLTVTQRGLLMQRISTTIDRLGKVDGTSLEIGPDKIVRLPAFRVVLGRIVEALKPHPDAARAVVDALKVGT